MTHTSSMLYIELDRKHFGFRKRSGRSKMSELHDMEKSRLGHFQQHLRKRFVSGLMLILPLGITLFILRFLFRATAGMLVPVFKHFFGEVPASIVMFISFITFLLAIYLLGFVANHVVGRKIVNTGERILMRLPVLRTIYGASKQVVDTFSISARLGFKSVVLVEFPRQGFRTIGFITGTVQDKENTLHYKVFIPTTPNPTSGFFQIIPLNQVQFTNLSIEEGIKMIVSGGILGPQKISSTPVNHTGSPMQYDALRVQISDTDSTQDPPPQA